MKETEHCNGTAKCNCYHCSQVRADEREKIEGTVYEKELRDKAIQIVDDALDEEYHKGAADEREKWAKEKAAMERVIHLVLMLPVEDALRDYDEDAQMRLSASIRALDAIKGGEDNGNE